MYLVFTCMPGESHRRRPTSLLLYLCYVFRALINSLCVDYAFRLFCLFGDFLFFLGFVGVVVVVVGGGGGGCVCACVTVCVCVGGGGGRDYHENS